MAEEVTGSCLRENELEEQYGDRYAQKAEDRLLQYLRELDAALQAETYIDKILKKQSPVTEEEKLLLEVITSDPVTIATTLKKLLHCDAASCHQVSISQSAPYGSSSKALLPSPDSRAPADFQLEVLRGDEQDPQHVSEDSSSCLDSSSDVRGHQRSEEDVQEAAPTPQFCSKHQRWVKSILRQCSDECSEELLLQANASSSPLLFQSSSSTSSSQDLTPSDLIPSDRPPSHTPSPLQTAAQASRPPRSASDTSHPKSLPEASCSGDICSSRRGCNLPQALAASSKAEMPSSPHPGNSGNFNETLAPTTNTSSARCPTPTRRARLPRRVSRVCSTNRDQRVFEGFSQNSEQFKVPTFQVGVPPTASDFSVSGPPTQIALVSTSQSKSWSSACTASGIPSLSKSSKRGVPRSSGRCHRHSQKQTRPQSEPTSTRSSSASSRGRGAPLKLSLPSQAVLLRSKLFQPRVSLTRLSSQECDLWTQKRVPAWHEEPVEQGSSREEEEEDTQSSFDVNTLYTTSSSDGGQSPDCDPDYKPHITKKALLLEYEKARLLRDGDSIYPSRTGDVHV